MCREISRYKQKSKNRFIDRQKFQTETGRQLYDILKKIWNNDHFIAGVMSIAKGDLSRQKLINAINNGMNDTDKISLYALNITSED